MRLCLKVKEIPLSWGISNIKYSTNEITFDVFGSKYQGKIIIIETDAMITVKVKDIEKSFMSSIDLFYWLDSIIE